MLLSQLCFEHYTYTRHDVEKGMESKRSILAPLQSRVYVYLPTFVYSTSTGHRPLVWRVCPPTPCSLPNRDEESRSPL